MAAPSGEYPPSAFYFQVSFGSNLQEDTAFQEVSGIGSKIQTEPLQEGGENRYVQQVPTKVEYTNLILKRGIAKIDSPLIKWCKSIFDGEFNTPIVPMNIQVSLLNENKDPIRSWSFVNAYPVSWEVESFNSTKNEVAIEKIELIYNYSERLI